MAWLDHQEHQRLYEEQQPEIDLSLYLHQELHNQDHSSRNNQ